MKNHIRKRFFKTSLALGGLFSVLCSPLSFAGSFQWNGIGKISSISIYPSYAIVRQGNVGGISGCSNTDYVSFFWSDFSPEVRSRIENTLLSAYAMKLDVQLSVDGAICGPEGYKKFDGLIQLN